MSKGVKQPLVSIGVTAYNSTYLFQSLESLTRQTYKNLEIIVSDDCSPDEGVQRIAEEFMANDPRVQYYRRKKNFGEVANSNFVLEMATGEYFMLAADHDIWDRTFISQCVEIMMNELLVVLCYSQTKYIDVDDKVLDMATDSLDTRSITDVPQRFHRVIWEARHCDSILGLIRSSALKKRPLFLPVLGADHLALADLSLRGTFAQIPSSLFYLRKIRSDETGKQAVQRRLQTLSPNMNKTFPKSMLMLQHLIVVKNADIGFSEKVRMTVDVILCFKNRWHVLTELRHAIYIRGLAKLRRVAYFLKIKREKV